MSFPQYEMIFGCGLIARTDLTRPFHVDFGYTGCFAVVTPKQHEQGALGGSCNQYFVLPNNKYLFTAPEIFRISIKNE